MMMPSTPMCEMQIPSYWFKIKETGKIGKAYDPHWDGIHLRLNSSMKWYTLDELEPLTEEQFNQELENIRSMSIPSQA